MSEKISLDSSDENVVICFQISIFDPLETSSRILRLLQSCCDLLSN